MSAKANGRNWRHVEEVWV